MKKGNEKGLIAIAVLLILLIFIVGVFFPLGITVAAPYSLVVLLTLWISGNKYTYAAGIITSILEITEILFTPDPFINWTVVLAARAISLIGIWAAVIVVLRQKSIEESEKKYKEKLDALFQHANEGIIIANHKGEIVLLNPQIEKTFGYTQDELLGKRIETLIPDRFAQVHVSYLNQYFLTPHARPMGMGQGMALFAKRKDGSEFPVEVSLNYFIIEEGKFAIAFLTDITERKKQEDIIQKEKERAQRYLDVAPVIFVVINKDQKVARINKVGCYLLGYNEDEVIGKNWFDNYLPKDIIDLDKQYFNMSVLGEQEIVGFYESRILRKDGTQRLIQWKTSYVKDESGNVASILSAGEDITEKRKQEEVIRKANQELSRYSIALETSNKDLEQFAYVASHDLQEPLRKIQSFGERLKAKETEKLSEQGKDYIERMNNAASRMQNLINDLLVISRITTKAHPFEKIDLNKILSDVQSDLEITIEKNKAKVEAEELPPIEADPIQIRQLFQNLIANACKFRKEEEPLHLRISSKMADTNMLQILFEDNGIGIEGKNIDNIFNIFHRLEGKKYEGSGIGLAVCKKIMQRHGGGIMAQSQLGKGTTFIVTLPIHQLASINI